MNIHVQTLSDFKIKLWTQIVETKIQHHFGQKRFFLGDAGVISTRSVKNKSWIMSHNGMTLNLTSYSYSEHVYGDEQSAFDCNTKETGCPNACYSG